MELMLMFDWNSSQPDEDEWTTDARLALFVLIVAVESQRRRKADGTSSRSKTSRCHGSSRYSSRYPGSGRQIACQTARRPRGTNVLSVLGTSVT